MKNTTVTLTALLLVPFAVLAAAGPAPVEFSVKLETVMKHDDGKFLWFHPRAAAIPARAGGEPAVVMTIQKHLKISDYYSGLHVMLRKSPTAAWTGPVLPPELDWRQQPDGVTISVADVTPGWHAPTGKLLAIGCQVRYSPKGAQLDDVKRAHQTVYAVFDPKTERWTPWQVLELPDDEQFNFARNACAQWLVKPDGTLLVPLYIGKSAKDRFSTTVVECRFDGRKLTFVRNSNVLRLEVARGLYEPSLIAFHGRYFLTLRNDVRGYVSVSDDGLQFAEPKPWLFDDGAELGSYNTQQHWLAHSDGLFLVYTRRGANNDHIVRHRAPLFMAQVNPATLRVMRATEKVVVPERGAEMGNFGACAISESESWVTVSEGMFMKDSKQRGAEGATFVARVLWAKPNKLVAASVVQPAATAPAFDIKLDTISTGFDKKSCWVHPRAGAIPGAVPKIVLTMNKAALAGSDIFGPLNEMRSDDLGKTWSGPVEHARTLGPREEPGRVTVTPSDFWPKWHAKSGKLLGIGHDVRYQNNKVMPTATRTRETVFSIYDPVQRTWTAWEILPMPPGARFFNSGAGSVQRYDLPDGDILLPIYFASQGESRYRVVVLRCGFDGAKLTVKQIGNELTLNIERGLVEPSLTKFQNRYYLTLRNDQRAYVSTSTDGLNFSEPRAWIWDDGSDLGSYNTQAHWVTHDDALFLCYTRRGANNDHIPRNRAPLFIAQVDARKLNVIRSTERELMPQRGAKLGNFGVTEVNEHETWVTDAEWMQTNPPNSADYTQCTKYGSDNAVFAARIQWKTPNRSWNQR